MKSSKIEILNHFDNLINQVDIDIEESLDKYNEEQVIGDLECYKSLKNQIKGFEFEKYESSINKSYEIEHTWLKEAENLLLKNPTNELLLYNNKISKTTDLWSQTKVVDYLNQIRMGTIEELRKAQEEALEIYKSQKADSKSELFPHKFYFQVSFKRNKEEWIFNLFTFVTDFYMSSDDIILLE